MATASTKGSVTTRLTTTLGPKFTVADTKPTVADFNAGRDLAVSYIRAALEADRALGVLERAGYPFRHTVYHSGVLRPFIDRITEAPRLIDGFDALLTNFLCVLDHSTPDLNGHAKLSHGAVYGPGFELLRN